MSKELKLYVPVTCIKPITRIKPGSFNHRQTITANERRTTLVAVHNCPIIKSLLPTTAEIGEHMVAQRSILTQGGQFTSIKVSVTPSKYKLCCAEVGCKMGGAYRSPLIDIVIELGQLPIIQIQGNKAEPVKQFKFTRPSVAGIKMTRG
jgi:hypothetical protein